MEIGLWLVVLHQEGALEALAYCAQVVRDFCQEIIQDIHVVKEVISMEWDCQCMNSWSPKLGSNSDFFFSCSEGMLCFILTLCINSEPDLKLHQMAQKLPYEYLLIHHIQVHC